MPQTVAPVTDIEARSAERGPSRTRRPSRISSRGADSREPQRRTSTPATPANVRAPREPGEMALKSR